MNKLKSFLLSNIIFILLGCYTTSIRELEFSNINNQLYIPVRYNNETYDFILDTGSFPCLIDYDILRPDIPVSNVLCNGIEMNQIFTEFSVGQNTAENIQTIIYDLTDLIDKTELHFSGILGITYLGNYVFALDYSTNKFYMSRSRDTLEGFLDTYSFKHIRTDDLNNSGQIFIKLEYDGRTYPALIDTGANFSCIPKDLQKEIQSESPHLAYKSHIVDQLNSISLGNNTSTTNEISYVKIESLKLLDEELENMVFSCWEQNYFLLGNDFLKSFIWVIDYLDNTVLITRNSIVPENNMILPQKGIDFYYFSKNNVVVKEVFEDSDSWKLGLRPGMQVSKLNDISVSDYETRLEFNSKVKYPLKETLVKLETITIRTNDEIEEVFTY